MCVIKFHVQKKRNVCNEVNQEKEEEEEKKREFTENNLSIDNAYSNIYDFIVCVHACVLNTQISTNMQTLDHRREKKAYK